MKSIAQLFLILLVGLSMAACAASNRSQDAAEPPARLEDQLIQRSIAARGGLEQIRSVQSTTSEAEIFMPAMGFTMPLVIYARRPGHLRTEVSVSDMGMTFVSAYDGETAWTINPMVTSRPQRLPADDAQRLIEQADMDGLLVDYASKGLAVAHAGAAEVGGRPAEKLRIVRADSSEMAMYLDAETFLTVRVDAEGKNPMDGSTVKTETYLRDYRDVHGIPMPFEVEVKMNGDVFQVMTIKDIHVNTVIPDSIFAFPGTGR